MRVFSLVSITTAIGLTMAQVNGQDLNLEPAPTPVETDIFAAATTAAFELAGAFVNDGYKIRDGRWEEVLTPDQSFHLEVNLFAGNEYWFCAATDAPDGSDRAKPTELAVTVFDASGQIVDQQVFSDGNRSAAGFEPRETGKYLVRVSITGSSPSPVVFIYCYK